MDEKGGEGEGGGGDGRRCQEAQFSGGRRDGWRETQGSTVAYNAMFWYHVQSFHEKPGTPKFATVTRQVTLSGDTCVRTHTELSSNTPSMDFFAGAMRSRVCTPRVTSVFKGPARCWWSRGGQPANLVRQRLVSCQRPAEVDLVGSETDSRLRGCAGNSTAV